jgi:hypothetical protein
MDLDLFTLAAQLYQAVTSGNWFLLAAFALVAAVFGARKFLTPRVPFFASDSGGVLLTFLGALGGGLATALAAGENMSWVLALASAKVAFVAMGGYSALKKAFMPLYRAARHLVQHFRKAA